MGVVTLYCNSILARCPDPWQAFVKHVNPDGSDEDALDKALEDYGAMMFELINGNWVVVFPDKETYTRFILTWS
jgi:hypothetical protein